MARNNGKAADAVATPKAPKFKMVNKIGTRQMGDGGKVAGGEIGDTHDLGVIVGLCTSIKTGKSQYGEFVGLQGSFEFRPHDGTTPFRSGVCYLPGVLTNQISAQLAASDAGGVGFAFKLWTEKVDRKESPVGYIYRAEPLMEAENDPLASIVDRIDQKLLPAPAKAA